MTSSSTWSNTLNSDGYISSARPLRSYFPEDIVQSPNGSDALTSRIYFKSPVPNALPNTSRAKNVQAHRSTVDAGEMGNPNAPSDGTKPVTKRKAADMKRLSGKLLIDTYSKRSKTLIEKAKELEKLTGAYVVIYTARPESVGDHKHRLFTSDNLRYADLPLTQRISGATDEINAAVIEVAQLSRPHVHCRKKPRTHANSEQPARAEQQVTSTVETAASPVPNNAPLAHQRVLALPMSTARINEIYSSSQTTHQGKSARGGVREPLDPRETFPHSHGVSSAFASSAASHSAPVDASTPERQLRPANRGKVQHKGLCTTHQDVGSSSNSTRATSPSPNITSTDSTCDEDEEDGDIPALGLVGIGNRSKECGFVVDCLMMELSMPQVRYHWEAIRPRADG